MPAPASAARTCLVSGPTHPPAAAYTYLVGVKNELWARHIPDQPARNDTQAGPYGRHADQVRCVPCALCAVFIP